MYTHLYKCLFCPKRALYVTAIQNKLKRNYSNLHGLFSIVFDLHAIFSQLIYSNNNILTLIYYEHNRDAIAEVLTL